MKVRFFYGHLNGKEINVPDPPPPTYKAVKPHRGGQAVIISAGKCMPDRAENADLEIYVRMRDRESGQIVYVREREANYVPEKYET